MDLLPPQPPGPTGPFAIGDRVQVPHTDKFYEAKVLRAERRADGLWHYLLHYTGWNKKWDEWVDETGLRRVGGGGGGAGGADSGGAGGVVVAGGGPGARKTALTAQQLAAIGSRSKSAAAIAAEAAVELELPAALKQRLLDQYDAICDDGKLVPLPRSPSAEQVLQMFVRYAREKGAGAGAAEDDIAMGLRVYFDKSLYGALLYKAEREQAEQALAAGHAPSAVYGAEHLLRLFVKLPELLPLAGADAEQMALLVRRLDDALAFLQVNASKVFLPVSEYIAAPRAGGSAAGGGAAAAAAAAP